MNVRTKRRGRRLYILEAGSPPLTAAHSDVDVMDDGEFIRCPGCGFYENEFTMLDGICANGHK